MSTGTKVTTETEMDTCKYTIKYIAPDILNQVLLLMHFL